MSNLRKGHSISDCSFDEGTANSGMVFLLLGHTLLQQYQMLMEKEGQGLQKAGLKGSKQPFCPCCRQSDALGRPLC